MGKQMELLATVSNQGTGTNPAFARHETFHPRYGWLTKGFTMASRNPHVFWDYLKRLLRLLKFLFYLSMMS